MVQETIVVFLPGFQKEGISRLLKEKGREQFWQKRAICVCVLQGKT
jgi:hypothetical protein